MFCFSVYSRLGAQHDLNKSDFPFEVLFFPFWRDETFFTIDCLYLSQCAEDFTEEYNIYSRVTVFTNVALSSLEAILPGQGRRPEAQSEGPGSPASFSFFLFFWNESFGQVDHCRAME